MLTVKQLRSMTGAEIIAHNRAHPGELDTLAAEAQGWIKSAWEYVRADGSRGMDVSDYHPTTDANQTRKLVAAVPKTRPHLPAFEDLLEKYLGDIDETMIGGFAEPGYSRTLLTAPLPLVVAAAVLALEGEE